LDDLLGKAGQQHFHVFKPWQRGAEIIVFYVHHPHGGVLGGEGAVDYYFECCDIGRGSGDVAGVVESVAAHGQPDTFLFFFVRFVIADYFAVSDLSVFRDVSEFDKETRVGARNFPNALE
jgi:hypothetical protein